VTALIEPMRQQRPDPTAPEDDNVHG
jgi:hypothetical protein